MIYFDFETLAVKVNRKVQTLRLHRRKKWLKAEKLNGRYRVSETEAIRWAGKYFSINLKPEVKP